MSYKLENFKILGSNIVSKPPLNLSYDKDSILNEFLVFLNIYNSFINSKDLYQKSFELIPIFKKSSIIKGKFTNEKKFSKYLSPKYKFFLLLGVEALNPLSEIIINEGFKEVDTFSMYVSPYVNLASSTSNIMNLSSLLTSLSLNLVNQYKVLNLDLNSSVNKGGLHNFENIFTQA